MTLELKGMVFYAYHGCLKSERRKGSLYTVDFRGSYDMAAAMESDALEDALDYGGIYDIVAKRMAEPVKLLEHLAGLIMKDIAESYPQLKSFSVCVSKRRPPVAGRAAWSRITLDWPADA